MMRNATQIRLDISSDVPAYKQIASQLRTFAVEGIIEPGDTLPPVRRLALELGVHFNTIAEAYRVLAQEGFLEITRGHRARAMDRTLPRHADPESLNNFRQRLRELMAAFRASGLTARQITTELKAMAGELERS